MSKREREFRIMDYEDSVCEVFIQEQLCFSVSLCFRKDGVKLKCLQARF